MEDSFFLFSFCKHEAMGPPLFPLLSTGEILRSVLMLPSSFFFRESDQRSLPSSGRLKSGDAFQTQSSPLFFQKHIDEGTFLFFRAYKPALCPEKRCFKLSSLGHLPFPPGSAEIFSHSSKWISSEGLCIPSLLAVGGDF